MKRLKSDGGYGVESVEVGAAKVVGQFVFRPKKIFAPSPWVRVDEKLITIGPQAAIRV